MKHFLTSLLFFIGLVGLAQPTYLDLSIQLDTYPSETSWMLTQGNDTLAYVPFGGYPEGVFDSVLVEETFFLEAGIEYKFYIFDAFGDGNCCGFGNGWVSAGNDCQGIIFEESNFNSSALDFSFTLDPCIPEIPTTDVTFRVDLANAPPGIEVPGVLGSWNGWQVIPMTLGGNGIWFADVEVPLGNHLWKFADFNNPEVQELPAGVNDSPCFLFDEFGFINRTLNITAEEEIILPPYCWESCLPCGGIAGCSNPSAINWNPWANFDDGSCIVQNTDCPPGETIIEIVVTPDNFGDEISWKLFNDFGEVAAVNSGPGGEYDGSPPGIPISTFLCIPTGVQYDLVIFDTWGDGLCSSCSTNNPNLESGNVQIFDCEGTELYNLQDEHPDGNFGYDTVSPQFIPAECSGVVAVEGCTNFNYVEYNPEATIDDGSCLIQKVYGCLDETQFNFDPEANTEDIIESCEFTLTITDGVGDGWFGSWLGIYQLGTIFNSPQYQMGPNDGTELSFNISGLDATQPAYIYFFVTPQSIGTAQQCGFTLTNSNGDVIIDVPSFFIIPFLNESGWYRYEINPYCGNTCEPYIYGCTSPEAINYNDEANSDDESCVYSPGCTNPAYVEYSEEADIDDGSCLTLVAFGCTDPDAFNFEEEANTDNGTCVPKIYGCTNELAFNYDPLANTEDGSCIAVEEGCTNPEALNYNPNANTEDFSCVLPILGCTDPEAFNFNVLANTEDGSCVEVVFGCTDETAFNYDPTANTNVGCESFVEGCTDVDAINYNPQANTDNGSCIAEIFGCTDPTAFNFDPNANTDNGSCEAVVFGCMDEAALNFNPDANTSNDNCIAIVEGCTDPLALNYNIEANVEDGSCEDAIYGCTDPTAFNYNELATVDNESCIPVVEGCMDPLALNFDPLANVNNFECDLPIYGCTDTTAFNYNELATTDNGSCIPVIEGCTNPEALNYNVEANTDDLSCILPIYGCTDETALNYDENANTDNGSCIEIVEGCTNPEALNYNPDANVEDFSCIEAIYGCTDSTAFNYNELATVDNGTCEDIVEGCTDPTAFNYNPDANVEDFSCEEIIFGCTEEYAVNYNPEANVDSGDCEAVYTGCMEQEEYLALNLTDPAFVWVISVSPSCCEVGWTDGCQELHDYYLDNNTVTSIEEYGDTQILVFPNPTLDRVNIASNLQINAVLYNSIGQPVLQETNANQLDLSQFEAGIYNLVLTYDNLKFNKKIIKQ